MLTIRKMCVDGIHETLVVDAEDGETTGEGQGDGAVDVSKEGSQ